MAKPIVTEVVQTKILLRYDILENWQVSTVILEPGEAAVEFNLETLASKFKVGDGTRTFSELPYSTLTPDEIQKLINDTIEYSGLGAVNSVLLSSGTNNGTLKLTINGEEFDNIAVTGLGSAAYTDAESYATASQGLRADSAMLFKGFIDTLPATDVSRGDTYSVSTKMTIPAEQSATNADVTVNIGAIITMVEDNKWAVLTASSGLSDDSQVSTDILVQGNKTIVFKRKE